MFMSVKGIFQWVEDGFWLDAKKLMEPWAVFEHIHVRLKRWVYVLMLQRTKLTSTSAGFQRVADPSIDSNGLQWRESQVATTLYEIHGSRVPRTGCQTP